MAQEVQTNAVSTATESSLKKGDKPRVINKFDGILKRARNLYAKSWLTRDIGVKRASLNKALEEGSTYEYTKDVFKRDFARRVVVLLDSKLFCKKCIDSDLDPYNAATHIVMMEGRKGIETLVIDRLYDGENSKFMPFPEWGSPIFPFEELKPYLDDGYYQAIDNVDSSMD